MSSTQRFQIHLRGLIDLLSDHLYSGPQVFLRELLQNGIDAVSARRNLAEQDEYIPGLAFEIVEGDVPTLVARDNGIGLTEQQVHAFLSTIGQSSKRDEIEGQRGDYIGQFGVGLLSCFMAANEIAITSRSAAEPDAPAVHWVGRPDGTYDIKTLAGEIEPGTTVYLRARPDRVKLFDPENVARLLTYYGALLPVKITLSANGTTRTINTPAHPWLNGDTMSDASVGDAVHFGQSLLGGRYLDAFPIQSKAGGVQGIAYLKSEPTSTRSRSKHRVYLKRMMVTDENEDLLPPWAVFVRCVLNAKSLRPVASREAFYLDEAYEQARETLGESLRQYIHGLSMRNPDLLGVIIDLHYNAIKGLASEDENSFRVFADHLPFETSSGRMTLGEYRANNDVIRYARTRDSFRQIAQVAAAQDWCVINAGYVYDLDLIEMLSSVDPEAQIEEIEPSALTESLGDLSLEEREKAMPFLSLAGALLQPFGCGVDIKAFEPAELPTLFSINQEAIFLHDAETTKQQADEMWADLIDNVKANYAASARATLCFNANNALIQKLVGLQDRKAVAQAVELLYVQSLLMGHHPLSTREMDLLGRGISGLIDRAIGGTEG